MNNRWDEEQKARIWRLYAEEQLTFSQIAQRFGHMGATASSISGLIGRMHKAREEQVDEDIEKAKAIKGRKTMPVRTSKQRNVNTHRIK